MKTQFEQQCARACASALIAMLLLSVPAVAQVQSAAARFSLTIEGTEIASFTEFGGLVSEIETPEGAPLETAALKKTQPGRYKRPTLTFRRGQTSSFDLWAWHEAAVLGGNAAGRNVSVVVYDAGGKPVARYFLTNAWPSRLEISAINAGKSQSLYETVTITAERVQRMAP